MIEQGIYFALGCIVTALAALCFTPLLWRRALRLTRRRLQLQVPLSMQEILAERDQLRAEFAVERVRMEQAMARVRATKGADMAELGRRTVDAVAMADQVAALRRLERAQDAEIKLLTRENAEIGAEAGAVTIALNDAHALVDRMKRAVEKTSGEAGRLRDDLEGKRAAIVRLEAQLAEARRPAGEGLGGWLKAAVATVTGLDIAGGDAGHEVGTSEPSPVDAEGPSPLPRVADEAAARDREDVAALRQSLRGRADRASEGVTLAAPRADQGISDRGTLTALEALRSENEALRVALREAAAAPMIDREADAALRDSIHALGLAVATMTRDAERRTERQPDRQVGPGGVDAGAMDAAEADALPGMAQGKAPRPVEAG